MNLLSIRDVYRASRLLKAESSSPSLCLSRLRGRLSEFCGQGGHAALSLAFKLIAQAQQAGEPAAWIASSASLFYPPDAAGWSVDWSALALVRLQDAQQAGRAADKLLRSGAFGLVILDLFSHSHLPVPLLGRLLRLAEHHDAAVIFLTRKGSESESLSSLVSLRLQADWIESAPERLQADFQILKDKRHGPGDHLSEHYDGPLSLR